MTFEQIMQSESFIPNKEQRPVIESTRNTVVSAGAGAGKTAVLSWRFLRLVMEQGVKPEQILTLTFTKKAANEMRERIYARLLKAKDSLPEGTLDSFRFATIATLDSFCSQIVRGDCTTYGLPRDIANLSDEDMKDITERLSRRFLSDPENADESRLIASLTMPSDMMERFFNQIAFSSTITGDYDAQRITEAFKEQVRELYKQRRQTLFTMFDMLGKMDLKGAFAKQYENMRRCLEEESFTESDYFKLNGVKDEEIKELVNEMKPLIGKDSGFPLLQNLAKGSFETSVLQKAVQKFAEMLNYEKRRLGSLTFNDVQNLSVVILRDNLEMRALFKERFKFIMIDEFQDNNSIQRDLLYLLAEKLSIRGEAGRIPSVEELEGEKLFFVGDEKQSIYRFRGADVSVFRHLQDEIGRNGDSLSLNTNYRSQGKLIRHFNDVFSTVLTDQGKDYYARYNPILEGRTPDGTGSRIILSVYNKGQIEDEELDGGSLEAEAIANYCYRAINTDDFLVAGKRPRPEDIAIIFRASSNQMNIEKALKRRGIEYQIAETRSLMLDAVASDFYCLLNQVLYPEDTRSLVALLKSPFCGLCEQSIHNVMLEGSDVLPVDLERYSTFLSFLQKVREKAFRLNLSQLLELIFIEGGYRAYLRSNEDRMTFLEHYEYLFSYAVAFDSEDKGLSDYVRFLRDNLGSSSKLPEASVLHSSKSGVQIMTVHKSKGLEFKLVIYAGIGGDDPTEKNSLVFRYGGNLVASEHKRILKILEDDRSDREKAEKRRLMYVAMTRAKDHLILIGGYKLTVNGELSTGDVLKWYADAIGADLPSCSCENPDVEIEDVSGTPRKQGVSGNLTDFNFPKEFKEFKVKETRISVTGLESHVRKPQEAEEVGRTDVDDLIVQKGLQDRFGTLCHLVLEQTLKTGSSDDVQCDICESASDNARLLSQARTFASTFIESDLYKNLIAGRRTAEELRFYTYIEVLGDVAVEGVIDLLVFGDECNLVVDYKTDSVRDPEVHRTQVLSYVKVAEEIYGRRCLGTLFYLRDGSLGPVWDRDGNCVELPSSL